MSGFRRGLIGIVNNNITDTITITFVNNHDYHVNCYIDKQFVTDLSADDTKQISVEADGEYHWLTIVEDRWTNGGEYGPDQINTQNNHYAYKIFINDTSQYNKSFSAYYPHDRGFEIKLQSGQNLRIETILGWFECFVQGTQIMLYDGTIKPIEQVTYDDALLVWNFDEGKLDSSKPAWIKTVNTVDYYYENKYDNGTILNVTGLNPAGHLGHEMFVVEDQTFDYIPEIVGKTAFSLNGNTKLISSKKKFKQVRYYNIITKRHFNLFANGILTSCSLNKLYPIKDMKFIKTPRFVDMSIYDKITDKQLLEDLRISEMTENKFDYINNLIRTDIRNN